MSTVKIKTEPAAAAAAATSAAVDVQVKLEPSLSTDDIKLEQHTSDIDSKFESDSDVDSDIKCESDDDSGDTDQATEVPKNQRQFICEHPGCGRSFHTSTLLSRHHHEHKLQTKLNMFRNTYSLARQSLNDRWPCPIPDCETTAKTANAVRDHIRAYHRDTIKQQHQEQHHPSQIARYKHYCVDLDDFFVNGTRCGYHTTTGLFICHECRLVPECMLTHLQQIHGYDEKSIGNSVLPESTVNASADPNTNQHTSNPHLAAAIRQPYQQQHQDVLQGWLCLTSNCGYSGYAVSSKIRHKKNNHQGEQTSPVPALVLRLFYKKTQASCFLITRIDQASGAITTSSRNGVNWHKLDSSHNGLNAQDENGDNIEQKETTDTSNTKRQWKCEYHNCGLAFNAYNQLRTHWREHKLETVVTVRGTPFTLTRQSVDDRWACSVPDCEITCKTIRHAHKHIKNTHDTSLNHKRANCEDDGNNSQQKPIIKKAKRAVHFLNVNDFYIDGTRYGYHTMTGLFICHECKLVPECLITHLQSKHGYDEKSIDNSSLPESATVTGCDPSINQHTSNIHLVSAIREHNQQRYHPEIFQGWLCTVSNCGYCCLTRESRKTHQYTKHRGEQTVIAPALVLRLLYAKARISYFLITRLDTTTNHCIEPSNSTSPYNKNFHIDDGDELVLSDYVDEDELVLSDMGDDDEATN